MKRITAIATIGLRELSRRRATLALLVLLPIAFYLARHDLPGQSTRLLSLGLGWTVATLALFTVVSSLGVDRRLRLSGYSSGALFTGRWVAISIAGAVLALFDLAIVAVDQDLERTWAIGLMLGLAVALGAPLGLLTGALMRRELEGALALLVILSMQTLSDPGTTQAKALPFWSLRQLGTYAVDMESSEYLRTALAHAGATWVLLTVAALIVIKARLRVHPAETE